MMKKWLPATLLYIALIVMCVVVIYVMPYVRGLLEKTYVTEYGKISVTDSISGYILRDEVVYTAAEDCKVTRKAEHNVLIKAKSSIVKIEQNADDSDEEADEDVDEETKVHRKYKSILEDLADHTKTTKKGRSSDAGYISYFVDGAESKLAISRLYDLTEKDLKSLTGRKQVDTADGRVRKGEPVFKVTKNRRWYLVFYLDNKSAEKYYSGRTVSIDVNDKEVPVRVAYTEPGDKKTKIALSCKVFFDGFLDERRFDTTVTVASAEGLVLKDSSLVEKDGQIGVLVKNKLGQHVFKPVSIKADNGEQCVAYSDIYVDEGGNFVNTIGTYDEIVEMPSADEIKALNSEESDS